MINFKKSYPTIIIASKDNTGIDELRHDLSSKGIYFHAADFISAKELVSTSDVLVIISPQYSSPATALLNYIKDHAPSHEIIYAGSESDVSNQDGIRIIPAIRSSLVNEIERTLKDKFNFDPIYAEDDEIICELVKPAQVYYNGTKLLLSKSEAKIVHFLLCVEPKHLVSKETIGEYLDLAAGAVPVHIHNINDKSMKTYHDKLIFSRSSRGYFVY